MLKKYLKTTFCRLFPRKDAVPPLFQIVDGVIYNAGVPLLDDDPHPLPPPDASLPEPPPVPSPPPDGINDLIAFFTAYLHRHNYSALTVANYVSDMRYWQRAASDTGKPLFSFRHTDVASAIAPLGACIARRRVCTLRRFALHSEHEQAVQLYRELCLVSSPATPPRFVSTEPVDALAIQETAKRLCSEGERAGVWLGLILFCGLRASEIRTVALGPGFVKVRSPRGVARVVPCPAWLCAAMTTIKSSGRGGFMQSRKIVSRNLHRLGYQKLYRLRYSFAALLVAGGRSMVDVQALLGHATIATTREYLHNEQGGLGDALELNEK